MDDLIKIVTYVPYNRAMPIEKFIQELAVAAGQFSTDSQKVVLISNKSGIRMLIPEGEVSVTNKAEFDKLIEAENEAMKNLCTGDCGMNYCDENGCIDRKRVLVNDLPIAPAPEINNEAFTKEEIQDWLTYAAENSVITEDKCLDILNMCVIPNSFIRQDVGYYCSMIVILANRGHDFEEIVSR